MGNSSSSSGNDDPSNSPYYYNYRQNYLPGAYSANDSRAVSAVPEAPERLDVNKGDNHGLSDPLEPQHERRTENDSSVSSVSDSSFGSSSSFVSYDWNKTPSSMTEEIWFNLASPSPSDFEDSWSSSERHSFSASPGTSHHQRTSSPLPDRTPACFGWSSNDENDLSPMTPDRTSFGSSVGFGCDSDSADMTSNE